MIRTIIAALLLLFIASAIVVQAVKSGRKPAAAETTPPPAVTEAAKPAATTLVAYYLHGNKRCSSCMKMEAFTKAVLDERFAADLASGAVAFRSVNIDEPANAHYVDDFQITTKTVILAEEREGKVQRYTDLKRVWDLVGEEAEFKDYIATGLSGFRAPPAP